MNKLEGIFSSAKGTLSSKRIFGGGGILIVFGCYIYAVISGCELPGCTEFLTGSCCTLLGVDSVTKAFGGKEREE